jgi:DNA-binding PadR family transcriptional regulator
MTHSELREPTFLILSALADGPKHGYAIIADAASQSGGRVRLQAGTLYAAIDRLVEHGLVEAAGEEIVEGRRRRYVTLTESGSAVLTEDAERQAENARRALKRLRERAARDATARAATARAATAGPMTTRTAVA